MNRVVEARTPRKRMMSKTSKKVNTTSTRTSFGSLSRQSFLMDLARNLEAILKIPGSKLMLEGCGGQF